MVQKEREFFGLSERFFELLKNGEDEAEFSKELATINCDLDVEIPNIPEFKLSDHVEKIKELCEESFSYVGLNWEDFVVIDKRFIRPTETGPLVGNPEKAKKILKWEPKHKFKDLVKMMVDANVARLK